MTSTAKVIDMKDQSIIKEFNIAEITDSSLATMKKQILAIPEMPEDSKQYNSVKEMHIQAKKILPRIEERRKELKAPVLEKGKKIDETAKKAVSMVQPLIDMSAARRTAWEEEKAKEKAEAERIETERVEKIQTLIDDLSTTIATGMQYNLESDKIFLVLEKLNDYPIKEDDFQERTNEAWALLEKGLNDLSIAYDNREKFEEAQAAQKAEAKRLEEEKAKLAADRKAQEEAAKKKELEEAEKRRKAEKKLEVERQAIADQKAEIEAQKKADAKKRYLADWDEAIQINMRFIPQSAIIMNIKFNEFAAEQAKQEKAKLKADKARVKLVESDKKHLKEIAGKFHEYISDLDIPKLNITANNALAIGLITDVKDVINNYEKAVVEIA